MLLESGKLRKRSIAGAVQVQARGEHTTPEVWQALGGLFSYSAARSAASASEALLHVPNACTNLEVIEQLSKLTVTLAKLLHHDNSNIASHCRQ